MNKYMILLLLLLLLSAILFMLGYKFTFNTVKTMSKFVSLARLEEDTKFFKILSSEHSIHWVRLCGIVVMIFALILFLGVVVMIGNVRS